MPVTLEEVKKNAEENKITLTEDQAKAHVTLDTLPKVEEETSSKDEKIGIPLERFNTVNDAKKDAEEKLKIAEDKLNVIDTDKATKKGDYDKLSIKAKEDIEKAESAVKTANEKFKSKTQSTAIDQSIRNSLLESGLKKELIDKALKLFDKSKVILTFTNEEELEYKIDDYKKYIEDFKKDNEFLYGESTSEPNNNDGDTPSWMARPAPKVKDTQSKIDKKRVNLENTFSALKNMQ